MYTCLFRKYRQYAYQTTYILTVFTCAFQVNGGLWIFFFALSVRENNIYTRFQKKVCTVFGDFPLPIMLNVHIFGTKIKIRTCTL